LAHHPKVLITSLNAHLKAVGTVDFTNRSSTLTAGLGSLLAKLLHVGSRCVGIHDVFFVLGLFVLVIVLFRSDN